jgi:tetratricopeptide (TPR) repeat protein
MFLLVASLGVGDAGAESERPKKLRYPLTVYAFTDVPPPEGKDSPSKDVHDSLRDLRKAIGKHKDWLRLVEEKESAEILVEVLGRRHGGDQGWIVDGQLSVLDIVYQTKIIGQNLGGGFGGQWGGAAKNMAQRVETFCKDLYDQIADARSRRVLPVAIEATLRAKQAFAEDDSIQALSEYARAIEVSPRYIPAHLGRGYVFVSLERYDEALQEFDAVLAEEEQNVEAWRSRGSVFLRTQQWDEAISACDKALEANPKDAASYLYRGLAYARVGELSRAAADQRRAVDLDASLSDQVVFVDSPPINPEKPNADLAKIRARRVNMRRGPGTDTAVVRRIDRKEQLAVMSRNDADGWYNVVHIDSSDEGWIRSDLLDLEFAEEGPFASPFQAIAFDSGRDPVLMIANDTDLDLTLKVGGQHVEIPRHSLQSFNVMPGRHTFIGTTPSFITFVGSQAWQAGYEYAWRFHTATSDASNNPTEVEPVAEAASSLPSAAFREKLTTIVELFEGMNLESSLDEALKQGERVDVQGYRDKMRPCIGWMNDIGSAARAERPAGMIEPSVRTFASLDGVISESMEAAQKLNDELREQVGKAESDPDDFERITADMEAHQAVTKAALGYMDSVHVALAVVVEEGPAESRVAAFDAIAEALPTISLTRQRLESLLRIAYQQTQDESSKQRMAETLGRLGVSSEAPEVKR